MSVRISDKSPDMDYCNYQTGILSCLLLTDDDTVKALIFRLFTANDFTGKNQVLFKDIFASYEFDGQTDMVSVWTVIQTDTLANKDERWIHLSTVTNYLVTDVSFQYFALS